MQPFIETETILKEVKEIIKAYRKLPPEKQAVIFDWLMEIANKSSQVLQTNSSSVTRI